MDEMTGTVDYKALLAKYIEHVGDMEGVDFRSDHNRRDSAVVFTDEEWAALGAL
ncbi:hypothetical protein [Nocardioides pakistanensis]